MDDAKSKWNPYLFFVLDDHPKALFPLVAGASYNRRLAHCDIKTAPEDPIHMRHRMRDVVRLALPGAASQLDVNALVVLPRRDAQRRSRHLCRDLIHAHHLNMSTRASGKICRHGRVMRDLFRDVDDARTRDVQIWVGPRIVELGDDIAGQAQVGHVV